MDNTDNQSTQSQNPQKQTPAKLLQWIYLVWGGFALFGLISKISLFFTTQSDVDYITPYYLSPLSLLLGFITMVFALTVGAGLFRYTKYSLTLAVRAGYVLLAILIINAVESLFGFIGIFGQSAGPQTVAKTATFSIFGFYAIIFLIIQLAIVIFTIKTTRKILKTVGY